MRGGRDIAAPALLVAALPACTILPPVPDRGAADWRDIGRTDGAQGADFTRLAAHRKTSAEAERPVDADAWRHGRKPRQVCPPRDRAHLIAMNEAGLEERRIEREIEHLAEDEAEARREAEDGAEIAGRDIFQGFVRALLGPEQPDLRIENRLKAARDRNDRLPEGAMKPPLPRPETGNARNDHRPASSHRRAGADLRRSGRLHPAAAAHA